jgi:hypothetical protein
MTALSLNSWIGFNTLENQSFDSMNTPKSTTNREYLNTATALFSAYLLRIIYTLSSFIGSELLTVVLEFTTLWNPSCCIDLIPSKEERNHAKIKNQC